MKPHDIHLGHYNDAVEQFHKESDRAAAILAGSFIEHYLAVLLKEYLVKSDEVDELFDGFGPLSTFSQRISMAAAMGLIDLNDRKELRAIKEIRNHFAHHPMAATFSDSVLDKPFKKLAASHDPVFNAGGDGPLTDRKLVYLFSISCKAVNISQMITKKRNAARPVDEGYPDFGESPNISVDLSRVDTLVDRSDVLESDGKK